MEQKKTLANFLHKIFTVEKFENKRNVLMQECDVGKIMMLWEILFEIDVRDKELLEEKIYKYGSNLQEKDNFGREVFVCLVTLLDLL